MNLFENTPPADNQAFRRALYAGTIFRLSPTAASLQVVERATALLQEELGPGPIREAQFRFRDEEWFTRIGRLRKAIYTGAEFHDLVRAILRESGFEVEQTAFDPMRLRVVTHQGYENPRAAPIYLAHRDTWYAHSQAEITWWIPLHDAGPEETFVFYPDHFASPVPNNSEAFDYDRWVQHGASLRIGWQNPDAGQTNIYPGQVGSFDPGATVGFAARTGEIVLFAGAQFHQTRRNNTGRTRFSLDFRSVHLRDYEQGIGAPNVDNRSTGSAVREYVQPMGPAR
jgi:hypothetical protein